MNVSKEEIEKKGYMEGKYIVGKDKAHKCCRPHTIVFNCIMQGTFNVWLKTGRLDDFKPSIVVEQKSYWFVKITREKESWYGWAIRDHKSKQAVKVLEILTKEKLPKDLKQGNFAVNIYERWSDEQITEWAKEQYWFQTFPFSPKRKADSEFIWNMINKIDWSGLTVLDIGCHYGYFSFKASEFGAQVIGMEPNKNSIMVANTIQEHILHQDVRFVRRMSPKQKKFDVILYLSVHHQIDPDYKSLVGKINKLKHRVSKHLFVELIMPPVFPKDRSLTEKEIDEIVGGEILARYKHNVRGMRKIYWIKKNE